ncbi:MAG TPA: alpha/beta fold hydrolase [Kribbella sp.]|nr:alpha/beta fold hydrolase [Kribbella sp.]
MTTYVLIHGAWHGGWCWDRVTERLVAAGHEVHAPTLTGLAERAELLTSEVGLRTHAEDVSTFLREKDLHDVVLVGHSYAGLVVREAADRCHDRVGRLVMVDAWAGRDGESLDSLAPEFFRTWVDSVTVDGRIAVPPASSVGVTDPDDVALLEARLTPHPRRTFSEPTRLTGAVDAIPCQAVVCTPGGPIPFAAWAKDFGWPITELESGHDAMILQPAALADILLDQSS